MTDFPGSLSTAHKLRYKAALADLAARLRPPLFHVTAMLPPGASQLALEDCLRGWVARVDRAYLGRLWQTRPDRRMDGLAFFEAHPGPHAHLIVCPPTAASPEDFLTKAPSWFRPDLERDLRVKPITERGRMMIQPIGCTSADLRRVTGYVTKEMEYRSAAVTDWKFIGDLSRR